MFLVGICVVLVCWLLDRLCWLGSDWCGYGGFVCLVCCCVFWFYSVLIGLDCLVLGLLV